MVYEGLLDIAIAASIYSVNTASSYRAKSVLTASQMLLLPVSRTLVPLEHLDMWTFFKQTLQPTLFSKNKSLKKGHLVTSVTGPLIFFFFF